jgi:hypothetical protein
VRGPRAPDWPGPLLSVHSLSAHSDSGHTARQLGGSFRMELQKLIELEVEGPLRRVVHPGSLRILAALADANSSRPVDQCLVQVCVQCACDQSALATRPWHKATTTCLTGFDVAAFQIVFPVLEAP